VATAEDLPKEHNVTVARNVAHPNTAHRNTAHPRHHGPKHHGPKHHAPKHRTPETPRTENRPPANEKRPGGSIGGPFANHFGPQHDRSPDLERVLGMILRHQDKDEDRAKLGAALNSLINGGSSSSLGYGHHGSYRNHYGRLDIHCRQLRTPPTAVARGSEEAR